MRRSPPKRGAGVLAVDTNVIVRYLTRDDARQAARALALISSRRVFIPTTVILETEWVLRTAYRFPAADVARAILVLAGEPNVTLEQPEIVSSALSWSERGIDFADALHLAASRHCSAFVTFDRSLKRRAKGVAGLDVLGV